MEQLVRNELDPSGSPTYHSGAPMRDSETDLGRRRDLVTWAGSGEVLTGANRAMATANCCTWLIKQERFCSWVAAACFASAATDDITALCSWRTSSMRSKLLLGVCAGSMFGQIVLKPEWFGTQCNTQRWSSFKKKKWQLYSNRKAKGAVQIRKKS